jgi:hypothetical protein
MSLNDTTPRLLAGALVALLLFVLAFFVGRGTSSDAALKPVRERPAKDSGALKHAPLRTIGSVPALPRAPRPPRKPRQARTPSAPQPPAAAPRVPVTPPAPRPQPPPPPPPPQCVGEVC